MKNFPLRRQLLLGALALIVMLSTVLFFLLPEQLDRLALTEQRERAISTHGMIRSAVISGMVRGEEEAVQSSLKPLGQSTEVVYAWVKSPEGEIIARYPPSEPVPDYETRTPLTFTPLYWYDSGLLHTATSLVSNSQPLGTFQLGFSMERINELRRQNRKEASLIILGLSFFLFSGFFALALAITQPVQKLTWLAHAVAEGKLEVLESLQESQPTRSQNELIRLRLAFQRMLERIQMTQKTLKEQLILIEDERTVAELERERAERALRYLEHTQEQLIDAEKMASLGQLISGIAHEINTPLGAIKASAESLDEALLKTFLDQSERYVTLSESKRDLLRRILNRQGSRRRLSGREARKARRALSEALEARGSTDSRSSAEDLIDLGYQPEDPFWKELLEVEDPDLLLKVAGALSPLLTNGQNILLAANKASKVVMALKTYSHSSVTGEFIPTQLRDNLETVFTLYQNQLKQGIEVHWNLSFEPLVLANPDELGQIWTNILYNAVQAMEGRGNIWVGTQRDDEFVSISLENDGPPIPQEIREQIFEPFFTTKPPGEGTGLGLDIVRRIAEHHQGSIEVYEREGRTGFLVKLPLWTTDVEQADS